jgi:cysteine synthase A
MVEAATRDGVLTPGVVLVESSSGNLGVAQVHVIAEPDAADGFLGRG